jgi:hypothetical protein
MAQTAKVLGQVAPNQNTDTVLYTAPAATRAVCSTLVICNQAAVNATFRVWVAVAGAATSAPQYLAYDVTLSKNNLVTLTIGISLAPTDVVRVRHSGANGTVSFNLFGLEVT